MPGRIIIGDALDPATWSTIPDQSVHCCVTSPPYYGLRDYGVDGQLGLEATPDEYIAHMITVFSHVWRVLRDDGTLWLNLGDSYASGGRGGGEAHCAKMGVATATAQALGPKKAPPGFKPKDLLGMPWRVALALQAEGWYLRQDIIWHKPNPMPESVRDRCTKAHEYIFLLTKRARYFYDAEAVKEPNVTAPHAAGYTSGKDYATGPMDRGGASQREGDQTRVWGASGRNKRSVWTIPTQPYPGSHFAVFPPKLIEPCILAGTSHKGVCPECGAPWEREVEKDYRIHENWFGDKQDARHDRGSAGTSYKEPIGSRTTGWRQVCACAPLSQPEYHREFTPVPATVLDPFLGAGTTAVVAQTHNRNYIGIELNTEYARQAQDRIDLHEDPAAWCAQDIPDDAPLFT